MICGWHQISIICESAEVTHCEHYFLLAGAVSISLEDAKDQPIFEPEPGTPLTWEFTQVSALFEQTADMISVKKYLKKHFSSKIYYSLQTEIIEEKNWIAESMKDWKPLCFGQKLWIFPSSESTSNIQSTTDSLTSSQPQAISKDKIVYVLLEPGLAFGTGTHPTTRLCLEWLDANPPTKATVIDYGCGSGILGISALKLGAKKVLAVDHDIQALQSTEINAEKNGISSKQMQIMLPSDLSKKLITYNKNSDNKKNTVDLILANILANPLIELASTFSELLKPNGQIVLSGILTSQRKDIETAYQPWFTNFKVDILEDWLRITATKLSL